MDVNPPRPLDAAERSILAFLLEVDFPGAEALRGQLDDLEVVGRCDCGCPTIDLAPTPQAVAADGARAGLIPSEARFVPVEDEPPFEIIAFADGGFLSGLELVTYGDEPLAEWPPAARIDRAP